MRGEKRKIANNGVTQGSVRKKVRNEFEALVRSAVEGEASPPPRNPSERKEGTLREPQRAGSVTG